MAAFGTVQDKTTAVPSIVNSYSDTTQPAANKSAGSLLEGASSLFEEGVNAAKGYFVKDIEKKVQAGYDAENDQNGVSRAALEARLGQKVTGAKVDSEEPGGNDPVPDGASAPGTGNPLDANASVELPAAAQGMLDRAQRMERANAAGRLTPTDYNAKMEALVRQVRAEYPQFRDEIDQTVSRITGITPANALRASMLRDQNTALRQAQTAETKDLTFVRSHLENLDKGYENKSLPEQIANITKNLQVKGAQDRDLAALNVKEKGDQAVSSDYTRVASGAADDIATRRLNAVMNPDGKGEMELMQQWKNMSLDQIKTAVAGIGQEKVQAQSELEQYLAKRTANGRTISENMGIDAVTKVRSQFNERWTNYQQQFTDGNFGAINRTALSNRLKTESVEGKLLDDRNFAVAAALRKSLGDQGMDVYLRTKDDKGEVPMIPLVKMISNVNRLEAAAGTTNGRSHLPSGPMSAANDVRATLKQEGITDPEVTANQYRGIIKDFVASATNDKADPTARYNLAKSILRDNQFFYKTFTPGSGMAEAYSLMTSPAMTDAMWKMNQEHPEVWQAWRKYTTDNFLTVTQMGQSTLKDLTTDKDVKVTQDATTGMFRVEHSDSSTFKNTKDKDYQKQGDFVLRTYQTKINDFNKSLSNLGYMLGKDKKEVAPELIRAAHDLGIDVNAPKDDFWGKVVTAAKAKLSVAAKTGLADIMTEGVDTEGMSNPVIGHRAESSGSSKSGK